jgi:hypothetical protein
VPRLDDQFLGEVCGHVKGAPFRRSTTFRGLR